MPDYTDEGVCEACGRLGYCSGGECTADGGSSERKVRLAAYLIIARSGANEVLDSEAAALAASISWRDLYREVRKYPLPNHLRA